MKIGVLALQGAFREHIQMIRACGTDAVEVRLPVHCDDIDGLVIPGGESTTISKLIVEYDMLDAIGACASSGKPIFGTCAGAILLADRMDGKKQAFLNLIDIDVTRNAYGRQIQSRESDVTLAFSPATPFHAVFIRAPIITAVGPAVTKLSSYNNTVILARQDNILVSTFHPELTGDTRIHQYFLTMAGEGSC
ncbi:MAG: pyridoxal 5'-phosphate synthase glutaminase subunit PdxT [Deltaproteobacteria bacterium]|nr:pyridoxal 5'-phosphate synthase glutaminase subunit PdxT [Deltaproteobacteria bacterium]MBN2688547.1 pyridoxal 5'-phosphate synthase glutaminase subunit PdxT [Deltaproteobacteria bacterium]